MNQPDPVETFRQEAYELLDQLEHALLDLERRPGDAELIDAAFRALHTIKGSGAMFGFDAVSAFTHHLETAFDRVRKGSALASPALIAVTLSARDHIRTLIEQPEAADVAAGAAILAALQAAAALPTPAQPAEAAAASASPMPAGPQRWDIRFRLPPDALATGTNPLLLLDELRALGPCEVAADSGAVPPLAELDPGTCYIGWRVVLTTEQPKSTIEQVFLFVLDDMQLVVQPLAEPSSPAVAAADSASASPDVIASPAAPAAVPSPAAAPRGAQAETAATSGAAAKPGAERRSSAAMPAGGAPDPARHAPARQAESIRVPAERLDELMDRVGELVIAQSRLKQIASSGDINQVKAIAEEIERLVLELRDATMGVRMVPLGSLFGRFRRLVHDLAHDLGKDIALSTVGEETELDKTVIERLADPLIHLIRNAADHGLEAPADRLVAGKSAQGRITLAARHAGHEVLISIADDGKGLDRTRILERAVEAGLLPQDARPADGELFPLLFQAGFSTAEEVTNLSGRGVGLDVVKRTVDALRGTIDIASAPREGTRITLRLPLTLAIIDGLLVRVGQHRYVIPLSTVEECVELSAAEDQRSRSRSFLNIRGDLVPFLRLREMFGTGTAPDRYQKVVIVSAGEQRVGLVVDQVIGDHQTVIKSLSRLHASVSMFSGATILGDGAVALILEVSHLVELGQYRLDRSREAA